MQILIEIPEKTYKDFMEDWVSSTEIVHAVRHGVVLPKKHGDLIDRDRFLEELDDFWTQRRFLSYVLIRDLAYMSPTVIRERDGEKDGE